jgi:hypothetical protein
MPHEGNKASLYSKPEEQMTDEQKAVELDALIDSSPNYLANTNFLRGHAVRKRRRLEELED